MLKRFIMMLMAGFFCLGSVMLCGVPTEHTAKADTAITLNGVFGDNMLLQRNKSVKIWGYGGTVGNAVNVSFNGQEKSGRITADGWEVYLDPMQALTVGKTLTVTSGSQTLTVKNVLVGELLFCSGQSNIAITVSYIANKRDTALAEYSTYQNFDKVRFYTPTWGGKSEESVYVSPYSQWLAPTRIQDISVVSAYAAGLALNVQAMLGENVPVGVIETSTGGSCIEEWLSKANMQGLSSHVARHGKSASVYYNGMVHFLKGMTLGGIFWYQGEACIEFTSEYESLLSALIGQYREDFKDENLPVYVMQLPQLNVQVAYGSSYYESGWIEMRNTQQRVAESIENTYAVCLIDTGDATDHSDCIHPADKWAVTKRAAGAYVATALNVSYDDLAVKTDYGLSPKIVSAVYKSGTLTLSVEGATTLTSSTASIRGFKAKLLNGNEINLAMEIVDKALKINLSSPITEISYLQTVSTSDELVYNEYGLPLMPLKGMNVVNESSNFTVRYMAGNEILKETTVAYGETLARYIPEIEGKQFIGWYLDEACTDAFSATALICEDTVLYAKFRKVKIDTNKDDQKDEKDDLFGCKSSLTGTPFVALLGGVLFGLRKKKK